MWSCTGRDQVHITSLPGWEPAASPTHGYLGAKGENGHSRVWKKLFAGRCPQSRLRRQLGCGEFRQPPQYDRPAALDTSLPFSRSDRRRSTSYTNCSTYPTCTTPTAEPSRTSSRLATSTATSPSGGSNRRPGRGRWASSRTLLEVAAADTARGLSAAPARPQQVPVVSIRFFTQGHTRPPCRKRTRPAPTRPRKRPWAHLGPR